MDSITSSYPCCVHMSFLSYVGTSPLLVMPSGLKPRRSPRHFLQGPGVAIGVAEGSVLDTLVVFLDLAHENTPANEHFACLVDVSHHQMQPLDRSRLHLHVGQASPKPD